jgi:DsbC/DsbD-like thiol-disulfide interchange protein
LQVKLLQQTIRLSAIALVLCCAAVQGSGQSILDGPKHAIVKEEAVQYLYPEQVTVPAGKSSPVALHFRIAPGLHVNSHTPKYEFLIPTALTIPADSGVKLDAANYPAGTEFVLPNDPGTKLNVYTGEFSIQTRITAVPGDHLVQAKLRYQACDQTQCMPPKTITVAIDVVGK